MKLLAVLISSLMLSTAYAADPDPLIDVNRATVSAARMTGLTAERVLLTADQALDTAAVLVSALKNDRLVHEELRRLAAGIPGARAILVINSDGRLQHDSYRYPADPIDLSDRGYFQRARQQAGLIVDQAVVGRTSSAAFVPIVKRIGDLTFVAVTSPYALVDTQRDCADCWSIALNLDGDVIAAFPPEAVISPELRAVASQATAATGTQIMRYGSSVISVSWVRNERHGLISVAVKGLPDAASVDIDVN